VLERRSNILVLQWARLGDLFHSRPALKAVRREFHPARVILCCDARYEVVARQFPEIDDVLPLNLGAMASMLRNDAMLPDSIGELQNILERIGNVDVCLNLTNHRSAWLFASLLASKNVLGYGTSDTSAEFSDDSRVSVQDEHVSHKWTRFVSMDCALTTPRTLGYSRHRIDKSASIICDAGAVSRSLTAASIDTLAAAAAASGATIVTLLGTNDGREVIARNCDVRDLRGMTDLTLLQNELENSDLVIGPDTGALHFAAALGKPTLGIYLDGASPGGTGALCADAEYVVANNIRDVECSLGAVAADWLTRHFSAPASASCSRDSHSRTLSIVIPEFAQTHYTDTLLQQLRQCDLPADTETIVISSGLDSIDTAHALARVGVVQEITESPQTFAEACNRGAMLARGQWLLFLNDDCELTSADFGRLWADRKSNCIVAPRLHDWDGLLQSAGFVVDDGIVKELAENGGECLVAPDGVSAAAMLIESQVFEYLGGFDQKFQNGYEDVDLCLRAAQLGINSEIANSSFTHYRGSSPDRHVNDDSNLALLRSLWPTLPKREHARSAAQAFSSCRLLLLSDEPPASAGPQIRWRSPLARMGLRESIDFVWLQCTDEHEEQIVDALHAAEVVVVFRSISSPAIREVLRQWRKSGCGQLVFDADDLLTERFPEGSARSQARQYFERGVKELLDIADIATAPNTRILHHHRHSANESMVIPSTPMSEHFTPWSRCAERSPDFRIGFAASSAHAIDLGVVMPAIAELLESDESVRFYWWGAHPGGIAYHPQVRRGGSWQANYLSHLQRIHTAPIDLWLVPLLESHANSARSPVKVFEYIGAGKLCLFSNVEPYKSILCDFPELLVDNTITAWRDALEELRRAESRERRMDAILKARSALQESSRQLDSYHCLFERVGMSQRSSETCTTMAMAQ